MATLKGLIDRIARGEKVHIPNLGVYCALYHGELRCFDKNSDSKKPNELHLGMDEILSSNWEIYKVIPPHNIDHIFLVQNAIHDITKVCNTYPNCFECPFKIKKGGLCGLKQLSHYTPDMWNEIMLKYSDYENGVLNIDK